MMHENKTPEKPEVKKKITIISVCTIVILLSFFIPIKKTAKRDDGSDIKYSIDFSNIELRGIQYANGWNYPLITLSQTTGDKYFYSIIYKNNNITGRDGKRVNIELNDSNSLEYKYESLVSCFMWGLICRDSSDYKMTESKETIFLPNRGKVRVYTDKCNTADYERSRQKLNEVPDHNQDGADFYLNESFKPYELSAIYVQCGDDANYIDIDSANFIKDIPGIIDKYGLRSMNITK